MQIMRQRWETITFLHWDYPIEVVQTLLPPPFEVEPWDGRAWVGLLPFFMRVRPPIGPSVPRLTNFPESNVRTYVRGPDGRSGVWFFSLDASNFPVVAGARLGIGLPYFLSRMRIRQPNDCVHYISRRLTPSGPGHDIVVAPRELASDDELTQFDHYLTARFRLWSAHFGKIVSVPVEHPPWPLRRARLERVQQSLLESAGLPPPSEHPVVHYSEGVDVRLGRPELIGK